MDNKHYVYFHINPIKNEVFYVGKGKGKRAYSKQLRNIFWTRVVKKYGFVVKIIHTDLSHEDALEKEAYWIKHFGRRDLKTGRLVNLTDGGEGNNNFSEETRKKISESNKGRKSPMLGIKMSDERKKKISETFKRKYQSGEWRPNISGLNTEEYKHKLSKSKKGKPTWNKGLKNIYSDDVKKRISEGLIKHYAECSPVEERVNKRKQRMKEYNKMYRSKNK